jgi:3-deoxy-7-phosphoheptulonate synthase
VELMEKASLHPSIMIDCSHGNSEKDHEKQPQVLRQVIEQIEAGQKNISGVMIESYLEAGNQPIPKDLSQLRYGVSITDKCIDWKTTEEMLRFAHGRLKTNGGRPINETAR